MESFNFSRFLLSTGDIVFMVSIGVVIIAIGVLVTLLCCEGAERLRLTENVLSLVVVGILIVMSSLSIILWLGASNMFNRAYHNNNTVTFPATTLIARNNPDEYTLQGRHTKPVVFNLQNGTIKQFSLVDVSAKQVSDDDTNTSAYFKYNSVVKLPLDKSDDIQVGDRVTTAEKTLHVDYAGKKAFELHVTKIERPVSSEKTQWRTVYEAK